MAVTHLTSQNAPQFPQTQINEINESVEHMMLVSAVVWAVHQLESGNPQAALATLRGQLKPEVK